jgi:plasmid stabilization system protein ParE
MDALRDTMKGLVRGTVFTRTRDDLRPAIQMATSGRHSIFVETDVSRIVVVRVLHDSMDYLRHLGPQDSRSGRHRP